MPSATMTTATVEDYLKHILLLQQEQHGGVVAMGPLAESLQVVPGTATAMMKKLADRGLVDYEAYSGVRLSEAGRKIALNVVRRHRLIETFLVEVLELDWSEVHSEAERLEHVISDNLLEAIDRRLGYPQLDPHGDPIPDSRGRLLAQSLTPLTECENNAKVTIVRVLSQDPQFLQYVDQHGLRPGSAITVNEINHISGTVTVKSRGHSPTTLGATTAAKLLVEKT